MFTLLNWSMRKSWFIIHEIFSFLTTPIFWLFGFFFILIFTWCQSFLFFYFFYFLLFSFFLILFFFTLIYFDLLYLKNLVLHAEFHSFYDRFSYFFISLDFSLVFRVNFHQILIWKFFFSKEKLPFIFLTKKFKN